MAVTADVTGAYGLIGRAWEAGPGRVYDHLAEVLVGLAPVTLRERVVLDVGAGTGAASRAIHRAGGRPVALDAAHGMLTVDRAARPPSLVADAADLPVGADRVDGAVAAFSLNHSTRPDRGLAELRRVCAAGSPLLVSAYADDDRHPVKGAVEEALRAAGSAPPPWYIALRRDAMPLLATTQGAATIARTAGLSAEIRHLRVPLPWLTVDALIAWRLGMAQHAPFVDGLDQDALGDVVSSARGRLGASPPTLIRSIIVLIAIV